MGYVQSVTFPINNGTNTKAFSSPNTQGNVLILVTAGNGSGSSFTYSDTNSNIYVPLITNFIFTNGSSTATTSLYIVRNCKGGSNTVKGISNGGSQNGILAEYTSGVQDALVHSALNYSGTTVSGTIHGTSGNALTVFANEIAIEGFAFGGGAPFTSVGDGSTLRNSLATNPGGVYLSDRSLSTPGTYSTLGIWSTFSQGIYSSLLTLTSTPATNGSILGVFSGSSLSNAFPSNPLGLDIIQVVNEGQKVVWNLTAAGVSNTNPSKPTMQGSTPQALLYQFFGSSLATALGPNNQLDIIQVVGQGQTMNFRVDYLGAVHGF